MFEKLADNGFQILTLHHAAALLTHDMADAVAELAAVLSSARIPTEELLRGSGGEGECPQRLRHALSDDHGWRKHNFEIKNIVDGEEKESISHDIDHVKRFPAGPLALAIAWNNKDPFFDRAVENCQRLHADGVISMGGIIPRGATLQDALRTIVAALARDHGINSIEALTPYYAPTARQRSLIEKAAQTRESFEQGWAHVFVSDKLGAATTPGRKLADRVRRRVGPPCPLLLSGLPRHIVV